MRGRGIDNDLPTTNSRLPPTECPTGQAPAAGINGEAGHGGGQEYGAGRDSRGNPVTATSQQRGPKAVVKTAHNKGRGIDSGINTRREDTVNSRPQTGQQRGGEYAPGESLEVERSG